MPMEQKEMELKNNAIIHKDNSLNRLDLSFIKHIKLSEYKKSELLAYWIYDYAVYHDEEQTFDIAKSGIFSRGDIIKVNLGFNIGNDLYNTFQAKIKKEKQKLQQILDELEKIEDIPTNIQNIIKKETKYIEKMENEVSKMKQDSIALISQITTISKQRIFKDTIRKNVRLSKNSLDLIDKQIIKYFTKTKIEELH